MWVPWCSHNFSIQTSWQINKDLAARIKMEAGITLGLTVGYQTDMLTYFLPLGRGNGEKNKNEQENKWVTFCFVSC